MNDKTRTDINKMLGIKTDDEGDFFQNSTIGLMICQTLRKYYTEKQYWMKEEDLINAICNSHKNPADKKSAASVKQMISRLKHLDIIDKVKEGNDILYSTTDSGDEILFNSCRKLELRQKQIKDAFGDDFNFFMASGSEQDQGLSA